MATAAGQGAEALTDERVRAAHATLRADRSIQFDLPGLTPPERPPAWLEPLLAFLKWLSPAFPYLFWGAVIAVALIVIYFILSNIEGFEWPWQRRAKHAEVDEDSWRPEERTARVLLAEAEALAAQGQYAEAARLLLQRSVEDELAESERRADANRPVRRITASLSQRELETRS